MSVPWLPWEDQVRASRVRRIESRQHRPHGSEQHHVRKVPQLQTSQDDGGHGAEATTASSGERLRLHSQGVAIWERSDWPQPVGHLSDLTLSRQEIDLPAGKLVFIRVEIRSFQLSHMATVRLLQGAKLSDVLIPNHNLVIGERSRPAAHLVTCVGAWEPWQTPPTLRDLVLAELVTVPDGLSPQEVLGILAEDALAVARSFSPT